MSRYNNFFGPNDTLLKTVTNVLDENARARDARTKQLHEASISATQQRSEAGKIFYNGSNERAKSKAPKDAARAALLKFNEFCKAKGIAGEERDNLEDHITDDAQGYADDFYDSLKRLMRRAETSESNDYKRFVDDFSEYLWEYIYWQHVAGNV